MTSLTVLEVFDALSEKLGKGVKKIAVIQTDGVRGKVVILDPRFAAVLTALFETPQVVMRGGQKGAPGSLGADVPVKLAPFSREAIAHAASHGLRLHNLRGVIVGPKP